MTLHISAARISTDGTTLVLEIDGQSSSGCTPRAFSGHYGFSLGGFGSATEVTGGFFGPDQRLYLSLSRRVLHWEQNVNVSYRSDAFAVLCGKEVLEQVLGFRIENQAAPLAFTL